MQNQRSLGASLLLRAGAVERERESGTADFSRREGAGREKLSTWLTMVSNVLSASTPSKDRAIALQPYHTLRILRSTSSQFVARDLQRNRERRYTRSQRPALRTVPSSLTSFQKDQPEIPHRSGELRNRFRSGPDRRGGVSSADRPRRTEHDGSRPPAVGTPMMPGASSVESLLMMDEPV